MVLEITEARPPILIFIDGIEAEIKMMREEGENYRFLLLPTMDMKHKYDLTKVKKINIDLIGFEIEKALVIPLSLDPTVGRFLALKTFDGQLSPAAPKLIQAHVLTTLREQAKTIENMKLKIAQLAQDKEELMNDLPTFIQKQLDFKRMGKDDMSNDFTEGQSEY